MVSIRRNKYSFGQNGLSKNVDPDQTPQNAASDQDLYCH